MKLIEKPKLVLVKKQINTGVEAGHGIQSYLKTNCVYIEIKPTRIENIQVHLYFPANEIPPKQLIIYYCDVSFEGYTSYPVTLITRKQEISKDSQTKRIRINTNLDGSEMRFKIGNICFESLDSDDFEFTIDVKLKYTYQVHGGKLYDEFEFEDGECHHSEGDTLRYNDDIELSVMEINHEAGIVYCSAIGFV